jgi:hypothetical protein
MSTISIFKTSPAMAGDFTQDPDCIALVRCDDSYDQKVLALQGKTAAKQFETKSAKWKHFVEVTYIEEVAA